MARGDRGGHDDGPDCGGVPGLGPVRATPGGASPGCYPIPPGVAVYRLARDPATGACLGAQPQGVLTFADIDTVRHAGCVLSRLRPELPRRRPDVGPGLRSPRQGAQAAPAGAAAVHGTARALWADVAPQAGPGASTPAPAWCGGSATDEGECGMTVAAGWAWLIGYALVCGLWGSLLVWGWMR
jgi:hypothetical protein